MGEKVEQEGIEGKGDGDGEDDDVEDRDLTGRCKRKRAEETDGGEAVTGWLGEGLDTSTLEVSRDTPAMFRCETDSRKTLPPPKWDRALMSRARAAEVGQNEVAHGGDARSVEKCHFTCAGRSASVVALLLDSQCARCSGDAKETEEGTSSGSKGFHDVKTCLRVSGALS